MVYCAVLEMIQFTRKGSLVIIADDVLAKKVTEILVDPAMACVDLRMVVSVEHVLSLMIPAIEK